MSEKEVEIRLENIPVVNFYELTSAVKNLMPEKPRLDYAFSIHIAGPSGVGKSTIAEKLQEDIAFGQIFNLDRYQRGHTISSKLDHSTPANSPPFIGGINPETYDFDKLSKDLGRLKHGQGIEVPIFDKAINERIGSEEVFPQGVLFIEGLYAFHESIVSNSDFNVYVNAPFHDRFTRKILRNSRIYNRPDIDGVILQYLTESEPATRYHERKEFSKCDVILSNPTDADLLLKTYEGLPLEPVSGITLNKIDHVGKYSHLQIISNEHTESLRFSVQDQILFDVKINPTITDKLMGYYKLINDQQL